MLVKFVKLDALPVHVADSVQYACVGKDKSLQLRYFESPPASAKRENTTTKSARFVWPVDAIFKSPNRLKE